MLGRYHNLLGELLTGVFIVFWFLISFLINSGSIETLVLPFTDTFELVSFLVFLPHGVRVIAVYLLGWRAVLPLFIAHLMLYQLFEKMPPSEVHLPLALVGALCPLIAFELLRACDFSSYYRRNAPASMPNTIGTPLLAGILAAIFNGLLTLAFFMATGNPVATLTFLLGYFIGDLLGISLILGALITLRRLDNLLKKDQNNS